MTLHASNSNRAASANSEDIDELIRQLRQSRAIHFGKVFADHIRIRLGSDRNDFSKMRCPKLGLETLVVELKRNLLECRSIDADGGHDLLRMGLKIRSSE